MRFHEFLRTTVLICAGAASALAAVTVVGIAAGRGSALAGPVAVGWWVLSALAGLWLGRRAETSSPIASLLAGAHTARSLPEVNPARTLLNRLWPLLIVTIGAAGVGFVLPQVPSIAVGFLIICALAWRRQASAVIAIEDRDGARFYIRRTSPLAPIALQRTPGFRTTTPAQLRGSPVSAPSASGR